MLAPRQPNRENLVLRAVGDIMLIAEAANHLERYGPGYPFGPVGDFIRSADLAFGNLEMPICSTNERIPFFPDVCPDFHCPPQTAEALRVSGFDVLNLANNHMMDWGAPGLRETVASLQNAGLQTIGAGETLREARMPAVIYRKEFKVGFLGYGVPGAWNATESGPGIAPINRDLIFEDMRMLGDDVDILVVSLHTGILSDYPNPEDRRMAKELVDHGASLILGHGPHVIQGLEIYNNGGIAHSLGNFIIDLSSGNVQSDMAIQEQGESIILDVDLTETGVSSMNAFPIQVSESFQTVPAANDDSLRILSRVQALSEGLDRMQGLALWQHAGIRGVEHEIRVLAFQVRQVGWGHAFKRLKKIRWRHLRLLIGYITVKTTEAFRRPRSGQRSL